jgi:hypothetical protein
MGFVEVFLKKERDVTEQDILKFISAKVEENLNLDYKNIEAYSNFDELSRDISAFANSAGGLIILGISEEESGSGDSLRKFPKSITWGSESLSKERLEDNIVGKIQPRIDDVTIVPVRKRNGSSEVIFLIDIPQSSNPPHMAGDNRYYKRLNFRRVPMEHYEVADLFGKRRNPMLTMLSEVFSIEIEKGVFWLRFYVKNIGKASAKNIMFVADFSNADITETREFQRLDELHGGIPSVQFGGPLTVFHPSPVFQTRIGEVSILIKDKNKPVSVKYSLAAEDTPRITGEFLLDVNLLKAVEQSKEKRMTLQPKESRINE